MMAAGNPNWWSMNGMHPQPFIYDGAAAASNPSPPDLNQHEFPLRSWSHLLLGGNGIGGVEEEEEEVEESVFVHRKKVEKWELEEQQQQQQQSVLNLNPSLFTRNIDVKQESNNIHYAHLLLQDHHHQFHTNTNPWPPRQHVITSPTFSFSSTPSASASSAAVERTKNQHRHNKDHSSECNSKGGGGVSNKKARVQQSSPQPALKVRKEKLGERITTLHQIVSPFGKTDTASVLSEAICYIRFLQCQIEALSSPPYMRNAGAGNTVVHHQQHSVQEKTCLFPEERSQQFLNDIAMDGRGVLKQDSEGGGSVIKDLRSRGLRLVPISFTQHIVNDNSADYWAPPTF